MRDVRSYLSHRSLPNANKKSMKKKPDEKTSMHVRFTYPVDTQYMPNLPRVWRMDTDVC